MLRRVGAVFGVGVAGVEQYGGDAAGIGGGFGRVFVAADAVQGLKGDGADLLQEFAQVGAAIDAAEAFGSCLEKALGDAEPDEALVIRSDSGADGVGCGVHGGFDGFDREGSVECETQPHVVQRVAGGDAAARAIAKTVCLGVGHVGFDIDPAVLALVAAELYIAQVEEFAGGGFWEGHRLAFAGNGSVDVTD